MDPFLYVQEEYENVARALAESLRFDYGPGQTVDYYEECRFRLEGIKLELDGLRAKGDARISGVVGQLWDLANRLTLIERSHLGEFSWPFADAIRKIACSLLSEEEGLEGKLEPIIHMIAEGTSYQISNERVMGVNKRRRLYTVAFPRQLKHHVLMHALFGHELGHATFYSPKPQSDLFGVGNPPSRRIVSILRREGPLQNCASATAWLTSPTAPEPVRIRVAAARSTITESNLDHWVVELICDLFGLAIFGPAFAAAHRTYLEPSCRSHHEIEIEKKSHPAYAIRRNTIVGALKSQKWLVPVSAPSDPEILTAELSFLNYIGEEAFGDWADVFTVDQLSESMDVIREYFQSTATPMASRPDGDMLAELVRRLTRHLPPIREHIDEDGISTTHQVKVDEQLYAGWTYWLGRNTLDQRPLTFFALNQLCDLALLQQQAIDLSAGRREL